MCKSLRVKRRIAAMVLLVLLVVLPSMRASAIDDADDVETSEVEPQETAQPAAWWRGTGVALRGWGFQFVQWWLPLVAVNASQRRGLA